MRRCGDALDASPWCRPAGRPRIELDRGGLRLPADLQPGRYYPAHLFGAHVAAPRDLHPVRWSNPARTAGCCSTPTIRWPAAGPACAGARHRRAAAPGSRLATLFDGPGMQAPPADAAACYFPPGALARRTRPPTSPSTPARACCSTSMPAAAPPWANSMTACCARRPRARPDGQPRQPPAARARLELCGLGLNDEELAANPRLAERVVKDLNACPLLPWADARFDAVICTASIEYLLRPAAVLAEARRVLKPGGLMLLSFSDRWFPTKAIAVWSRLHEFERLGLVLHLLHAAGFADLHTETRRGLPRPADDKYLAQRAFADPPFSAWGYAPA
jgi:hypothetical protein